MQINFSRYPERRDAIVRETFRSAWIAKYPWQRLVESPI